MNTYHDGWKHERAEAGCWEVWRYRGRAGMQVLVVDRLYDTDGRKLWVIGHDPEKLGGTGYYILSEWKFKDRLPLDTPIEHVLQLAPVLARIA